MPARPRVSPATAASPYYNSAGPGHVSTDSGGPALRSCTGNQWFTEIDSVITSVCIILHTNYGFIITRRRQDDIQITASSYIHKSG